MIINFKIVLKVKVMQHLRLEWYALLVDNVLKRLSRKKITLIVLCQWSISIDQLLG